MGKKNGALLSICSNTVLILLKIVAGLIMGSVSVISEAIHSSIDLIASIIAYFSIKEASKAPDAEHNFGHGKAESISGFVEALLILLAGILIIIEAVKKILSHNTIENVSIGIVVMLIGSLVNFFISRMLHKISKKTNSLALEADALHLLTDVYTSAGVMIGLILIKLTGIVMLDSITAFVVALLITKTSVKLIKECLSDLMDTRLNDNDVKKITDTLNSYNEIKSFHKLRTRKSGNNLEIDVHIKMEKDLSLEYSHEICCKIENSLKSIFPNSYITLHEEPYLDKIQQPN